MEIVDTNKSWLDRQELISKINLMDILNDYDYEEDKGILHGYVGKILRGLERMAGLALNDTRLKELVMPSTLKSIGKYAINNAFEQGG